MLKRISLVVLGFAAAHALASSRPLSLTPRIVGGVVAGTTEFPFIASLHDSSGGHYCGGSLIAKHWVLTAGHCIDYTVPAQIFIGMHNQKDKSGVETFTAKRALIHPKYDGQNQDFDYALVELDHDSTLTPIALNNDDKIAASNLMATAAGWGVLNQDAYSLPDDLYKVDVPLITNAVCDKAYPGQVTDRMICAGYPQGGKDACQGDSGGPLTVTDANGARTLVGIVSWGDGCAQPNKYGVYSDVSQGAAWIAQTAQ
jgi:secreted trypsin-like serine protease